ncbi:MAG: DUF1987 domain-containing protein [Crocinitomicaceae bacterium]
MNDQKVKIIFVQPIICADYRKIDNNLYYRIQFKIILISLTHSRKIMNVIDIKETSKSLKVYGNMAEGTLLLSGKSLPENAREFFTPVLEWIDKLSASAPQKFQVDLEIEYYNTSTSSIIYKILNKLKQESKNREVQIIWHFEEDDLEMEEVGIDLQEIIGTIMTLKPKKSQGETVWVK